MLESKEILRDKMVFERDHLLWVIGGLTSDQACAEAFKGWAIKDMIAHLAACDFEITKQLNLLIIGRESEVALIQKDELAAWNKKEMAARRDLTWNQILAQLAEARKGLLAAWDAVSEEKIAANEVHAPWSSWLPEWAVQHVASHSAEIQAWRAEKG